MSTTTEISKTTETILDLRIVRYDSNGVAYGEIYKGKASRPYANYRFQSFDHREAYIANEIEGRRASIESAAKRKAEQKAIKDEIRASVKVGDLFAYSWGYDQTNVDFFQVVEKRGASVVVRQVASEMQHRDGYSSMSGYTRAIPDAFIGEPITKVLQAHGLTFDYGIGRPTSFGEWHYTSWYA